NDAGGGIDVSDIHVARAHLSPDEIGVVPGEPHEKRPTQIGLNPAWRADGTHTLDVLRPETSRTRPIAATQQRATIVGPGRRVIVGGIADNTHIELTVSAHHVDVAISC